MTSYPDPAKTFPPLGVVAYLSRHGPVVARTLRALDRLRAYSDYESCMPTLSCAQLAVDWNFSLTSIPRDPIANPLTLSAAEIAAEWDPYKLAALVDGSAQDLSALAGAVGKAQRDVHDVDRVLKDVRRKVARIDPNAYHLEPVYPQRQQGQESQAELVARYKVDRLWDVYKLRDVFSAAQADVGRLMGRLADLRTELQEKRRRVDGYRRKWNV